MHLYVITGTSRGLGAALAEQVLSADTRLLAIARGTNAELARAARERRASLEQWSLDLADAPAAAAKLESWLLALPSPSSFASATLINNAGVLAPVGPVERSDTALLASVLRVDIEAPILLTASFLRATASWRARRRVVNISSGAGSYALAGWSTYCAAKAALDNFSRAVALDEELRASPAAVVSIAPGVVETAMQAQLRTSDPTVFPARQRFLDLHDRGELASPHEAAARLLTYLERPEFGTQPVVDVRKLPS